jgi:hypothetical protein
MEIEAALPQALHRLFTTLINTSNGVQLRSAPAAATRYKVYIGKGNNGDMIRHLFVKRGCWKFAKRPAKAHVIWT